MKTRNGANRVNILDHDGNVQAAVNALPAAGGVVVIPAGTYALPAPVELGAKAVRFEKVATDVGRTEAEKGKEESRG